MSMPILVILNELTLVGSLWDALLRRQPRAFLCCCALFPPLNGILERLSRHLLRRGWLTPAATLFPPLAQVETSATALAIAQVYPRCESAIIAHFRFDVLAPRLGDRWAQAYRHASMGYFKARMGTLLALQACETQLAAKACLVAGMPREWLDMFQAVWGRAPLFRHSRPRAGLYAVINFFSALLMMIAALQAVLATARRQCRPARITDLGYDQPDADFNGSATRLAMEIVNGDPERIVFVFRNSSVAERCDRKTWQSYKFTDPNSGCLPAVTAMATGAEAVLDIARLFMTLKQVSPHRFLAVAKLAVKRIRIRALLFTHPVRAFLSRDDYNSEHIIRSQELRRIGSLSLGINHGLPTAPARLMHWQYLDFDRYFTFGRYLYDTFYRHTWSRQTCPIPIGCWGISSEQFFQARQQLGEDIVYFANPLTDPLPLVQAAARIAENFPDRTVWAKVKIDYEGADPKFYRYLRMVERRLANFKVTYENPYGLIVKSKYVIGGLTTALVEAAQFNRVGLFLDFYPKDIEVLFRYFPEMCVSSADMAVEKLKAVDSGEARFPFDALSSLIDCPEQPPFITIRSHIPTGTCQ